MPVSDALANNLLDVLFGGDTSDAPATYHVGLSTSTPTATGTNVTEPAGNGYVRVAVTNNATNWPAASARSKSNGTVVVFDAATGSWGVVTHFVLYGASTGGTFYGFGLLAGSQTINNGGVASFPAGSLVVTSPVS